MRLTNFVMKFLQVYSRDINTHLIDDIHIVRVDSFPK